MSFFFLTFFSDLVISGSSGTRVLGNFIFECNQQAGSYRTHDGFRLRLYSRSHTLNLKIITELKRLRIKKR